MDSEGDRVDLFVQALLFNERIIISQALPYDILCMDELHFVQGPHYIIDGSENLMVQYLIPSLCDIFPAFLHPDPG